MALSRTAQVPHASATLTAGGGTVNGDGGWLAINYGVCIIAKITNSGSVPTGGAQVYVEVAQDGSGTNPDEVDRRMQGDLTAAAVNRFIFNLGIGGNGGDYSHYRVSFVGPTGNDVTAVARAMTTTAL
jgi:hypothetical protein